MVELGNAMKGFSGLTVLTLVFLVASVSVVLNNRTVSRRSRRVFICVLLALFCIAAIDWFVVATSGQYPELRVFQAVCMALTFAVAPFLPVAIANAIFPAKYVRWMFILLVVHAVFQIGSIFGGYVFWIDENNVYHRGPLYIVYMAVYSVASLYLVIESVRMGRAYQSSIIAIVAVLACLVTGVLIQVFDSTVRMTWPAVAMTVILFFAYYSDMVLRADALTKLLNRRSYEEFIARPKLPCVVMVIDVDDFKHVNDTYGHAYGDECLSTIATCIRKTFGMAAWCYRTGGDEFAVMLTRRLDEADAFAASLKDAIARVRVEDERMPSVSIGYAVANAACTDFEAVIEAADKAMYESKRQEKLAVQAK